MWQQLQLTIQELQVLQLQLKLWNELPATSFNDLSAKRQPTEAPKISKQKFILSSGSL